MEIRQVGRKWFVMMGNATIASFDTHAEAWRYVDKNEGEPNTPAQNRSDYWWKKTLADR